MPNSLKIAQIFPATGNIPSKASIYLKVNGTSSGVFIFENNKCVIDSTNFSQLEQSVNKAIYGDEDANFTGSGYINFFALVDPYDPYMLDDFPVVCYTIQSSMAGLYNCWIRVKCINQTINVEFLFDGKIITKIVETGQTTDWQWVKVQIVIPDNKQHILGIKLKDIGIYLDKIYIDYDLLNNPSFINGGLGPNYTTSPFITTHLKLYSVNNDFSQIDPLYIYDYKNSIDEIINDGWYNFRLEQLIPNALVVSNYYAIVVINSGGSLSNYIIWELTDNSSEQLPSAIRYN